MLETVATAKPNTQFERHLGPVTCVAAVPENNWAVTSAYDGAVGLFDLSTGDVSLLGYHEHLANRICVNARGTLAASCSADYNIYLWDLETRQIRRVLRGHSDDVEDFAFVDDRLGVSISQDARLLVWNLETGAIENILLGHEKCILSVEYFDGRVFTSGDDKTLRMWDLESGKQIHMWGPLENEADSCALDGERGRVILGCDDGKIRVFETESGKSVAEFPAHESGIKKVAVSPVNGDILSAAYDQQMFVWDAQDYQLKTVLEHKPTAWERSFNWSPDGRLILAGTFDGTVLIWNAQAGVCIDELGAKKDGNACLNEVSATDSGELLTVSDDGFVRLGKLSAGAARWRSRREPDNGRMLANACTLSPQHRLAVTGAHDQTLHLFDVQGGALTNEIEVSLGEGPINCVRVADHKGHEGQSFVACYNGPIVQVSRTGEILQKISLHEGSVKALRLHPTQPLGISCSADGAVLAWDFAGNLLDRYIGHLAIADDVDFDPTGTLLCSVSRDFTAKIFRLNDGKLVRTAPIGRQSPKAVCFYDSNTVVVTNYWGWLIRIDLVTGKILKRRIAQNGLSSISRAGESLIASSYDGALYRVNPSDLRVSNVLRAMTQRQPADTAHAT